MNEKYFVVCGTRKEYNEFTYKKLKERWASDNNSSATLSNFDWLYTPEKLMGVRNPHGWFIGTWYEMENIKEILTQLLTVSDDPSRITAIHRRLKELEK